MLGQCINIRSLHVDVFSLDEIPEPHLIAPLSNIVVKDFVVHLPWNGDYKPENKLESDLGHPFTITRASPPENDSDSADESFTFGGHQFMRTMDVQSSAFIDSEGDW